MWMDSNGRVGRVEDPLGAATDMAYDTSSNLVSVVGPTGLASRFAYDALGRRIRKIDSVAGQTTLYYHNYNWKVRYETKSVGSYICFSGLCSFVANWLAGLVVRHIVDTADATQMAHDLAYNLAKQAYKLG